MANYKIPPVLDYVDIGGYVHILKENDRVIYLDDPGGITTRSLHDTTTNTNYQVPTGKKARIIYCVLFNLHGTTGNLGSTTAADANTGMVVLTTGVNIANVVIQSAWFGEDLFLTNENQFATYYTRCYIVETDA